MMISLSSKGGGADPRVDDLSTKHHDLSKSLDETDVWVEEVERALKDIDDRAFTATKDLQSRLDSLQSLNKESIKLQEAENARLAANYRKLDERLDSACAHFNASIAQLNEFAAQLKDEPKLDLGLVYAKIGEVERLCRDSVSAFKSQVHGECLKLQANVSTLEHRIQKLENPPRLPWYKRLFGG